MTNDCCQTPLVDLLRGVPADARTEYEVNPTHHKMIPVGLLCHDAADENTRLLAELDASEKHIRNMDQGRMERDQVITDLRTELAVVRKLCGEAARMIYSASDPCGCGEDCLKTEDDPVYKYCRPDCIVWTLRAAERGEDGR